MTEILHLLIECANEGALEKCCGLGFVSLRVKQEGVKERRNHWPGIPVSDLGYSHDLERK